MWSEFLLGLCLSVLLSFPPRPVDGKPRNLPDQSIRGYATKRACYWNELCKEEFQPLFKCRCPRFSFCRSAGKYYNARCAMTSTGYIWMQPETSWSLKQRPLRGRAGSAAGRWKPRPRRMPPKNRPL